MTLYTITEIPGREWGGGIVSVGIYCYRTFFDNDNDIFNIEVTNYLVSRGIISLVVYMYLLMLWLLLT